MIVLKEKNGCTGCAACISACPKDCISMQPDREGFLYPEIDKALCISCGKCEAVCPVSNRPEPTAASPEAYAVKAKDNNIRLNSSSGGVFTLLAEDILSQGGAVFGAEMSSDCKSARHVMVTTPAELSGLRGSKYLQSRLDQTFRQVRQEVDKRPVLFTGTPCQIDGLKSYLGRDYENLLCMEVICHGVPTQKLWAKYVEYMEAKLGGELVSVEFRHKKCGWHFFGNRLENSNRRVLYSTLRTDSYMRIFLRDLCLRPSCYQCTAKGLDRRADLTAGDFWGIEQVAPELDDDKGTSLVLSHSNKGRKALQRILERCDWREVDCAAALKGNPAMLSPAKKPEMRAHFMDDLDHLSLAELQRRYVPVSAKDQGIALLQKTGLFSMARRVRKVLRGRR